MKRFRQLYQRIATTLSRHRWELALVRTLPRPMRNEFYLFYLVRWYIKLPFHFPFPPHRERPFFYVRDLLAFAPWLRKMSRFDSRLHEMIGDFYSKGVRAWEYGKFLSTIQLGPRLRALDVGPGSSTFPYFLAHLGVRVTTVDLPMPMERRRIHPSARKRIQDVYGTVTNLPFADESFDVVYAISTIEHLDTNYSTREQLPYSRFVKRTKRALREMIRVLKIGGWLYITTDAFLPKQKTDRWRTDVVYRGIGGAYRFEDIRKTLVATIVKSGCATVYPSDFPKALLLKSPHYSNYRGRYITTVALVGKKVTG